MKKALLFTALIVTANSLWSQVVEELNPFFGTTFYNIEQDNRMFSNTNIDLKTVTGTPYENDVFVLGTALEKISESSKDFFMRYNIYNDAIEIKKSKLDKVATNLIKSENISVSMNGKKYFYRSYLDKNNKSQSGYFILISERGNYKLYLKKRKKFVPKQISKEAFIKDTPAAFKDDNAYYFEINNSLRYISRKKKAFLKEFSEDKAALTSFLKKEKIDLKKEKDLIRLLNFYMLKSKQ